MPGFWGLLLLALVLAFAGYVVGGVLSITIGQLLIYAAIFLVGYAAREAS